MPKKISAKNKKRKCLSYFLQKQDTLLHGSTFLKSSIFSLWFLVLLLRLILHNFKHKFGRSQHADQGFFCMRLLEYVVVIGKIYRKFTKHNQRSITMDASVLVAQ